MAALVNVPIARANSFGTHAKFAANDVDALAEALSLRPFTPPTYKPPPPLDTFGYDEYRDIRFRPEQAVWQDAAAMKASTCWCERFAAPARTAC